MNNIVYFVSINHKQIERILEFFDADVGMNRISYTTNLFDFLLKNVFFLENGKSSKKRNLEKP